MYIFIKISLGFLGFISLAIFFLTLIFSVKFMFFTDPLIGKEIFNYEGICGFNNTTSLANKKCQNLMTIYWLFVVGFGFLILSLITVYPFLKMNSKKKLRV